MEGEVYDSNYERQEIIKQELKMDQSELGNIFDSLCLAAEGLLKEIQDEEEFNNQIKPRLTHNVYYKPDMKELSEQEQENLLQKKLLEEAKHPILIAARVGNMARVKEELEKDPQSLEKVDFGGCTPLLLSCMRHHIDLAVYLISIGANYFHRDNTGRQPLDYLRSKEERNMVQYAHYCTTSEGKAELERKAREDAELDARLTEQCIPQFIDAAFRGDIDTLAYYLEWNPDMVFSQDKWGNTALIAASATNQREAAEYLLEAGSRIRDKHPIGYTALSFARGPKAYAELEFFAESATIEYKANQHAKTLWQMAVDHAWARAEIEKHRKREEEAARRLREYLAMVKRTQQALSKDVSNDVCITSTEAAFIGFMMKEEDRLNRLAQDIEDAAVADIEDVDAQRLAQLRSKFAIEKSAIEKAKKLVEEDSQTEIAQAAKANVTLHRIEAARLKEERKLSRFAQNRVIRQYDVWVEQQKQRAMERDRKLMPRKIELTMRLSKSAKQAAGL
jgi:ankyrin repeat protein